MARMGHIFAFFTLLPLLSLAEPKPRDFPTLKGATLLSGYPGAPFALVKPRRLKLIGLELYGAAGPSITVDGQFIAATKGWKGDTGTLHHHSTVVLYDVKQQTWRELTELLADVTCVSMSPDHSKIAYVQQERNVQRRGTAVLHIIDARTGVEITQKTLDKAIVLTLSWSPAADKLAFDEVERLAEQANPPNPDAAVLVFDLAAGTSETIAHGSFPAWSPSGEWIAYLDRTHPFDNYVGIFPTNRVMLVHPDGSEPHSLIAVGRKRLVPWILDLEQRQFWYAPVWSPDSHYLLVNEFVDWEKYTFDVHLVDVATGHMRRISRAKAPVYGWANSAN